MNPIPELRRNNCTYNGKRDIIQIKERKSNCTAVSFRWWKVDPMVSLYFLLYGIEKINEKKKIEGSQPFYNTDDVLENEIGMALTVG